MVSKARVSARAEAENHRISLHEIGSSPGYPPSQLGVKMTGIDPSPIRDHSDGWSQFCLLLLCTESSQYFLQNGCHHDYRQESSRLPLTLELSLPLKQELGGLSLVKLGDANAIGHGGFRNHPRQHSRHYEFVTSLRCETRRKNSQP